MDEPTSLLLSPDERYQKNREILRQTKGEAFVQQIDNIVLTNLQLQCVTPQGPLIGAVFDTPTQQWVNLTNPAEPLGEAQVDAQTFYTRDARVFMLLGFGLGYFARELVMRLQPHQRLGIFETSPALFKAGLHAVDIQPFCGGARVELFIGDGVERALEQWFLSFDTAEKQRIATPLRSGFATVYDVARYRTLMERTEAMLRHHAVGLATWQQFGHCIGENDLANVAEYVTVPGLEQMRGRWRGQPAICIAAGPSLRRNLSMLLEVQRRMPHVAVLSVATVYAVLQGLGIIPDVVTTIDFQRLNYTDQVQGVPIDRRSALLYLHSVDAQVPRRWPGPRFVARNASDFTEWLRRYTEEKGDAASVQTVAHLNVIAALVLGCNPIILLGQDLSQPRDVHHAPGARAVDTTVDENPSAHIEARDIYDAPVWTRHSFLSMRTVFERIFAEHPDTRFINCTEGGLHLAGSEDRPLREVLEELAGVPHGVTRVPRLREVLREVSQQYQPVTTWDDLIAGLQGVLEQGRQLIAAAGRVLVETAPGEEVMDGDAIQRCLAEEATWQSASDALGMVIVRRFDIVQLLSEPPVEPSLLTPDALQRWRVARLCRMSRAIVEEGPTVERHVQQCIARLQLVMPSARSHSWTFQDAMRWVARQGYATVAEALQCYRRGTACTNLREAEALVLEGLVAFHQHEFQAAVELLRRAALAPGLARWGRVADRAEAILDAYRDGMLPAVAPYIIHRAGWMPPERGTAPLLEAVVPMPSGETVPCLPGRRSHAFRGDGPMPSGETVPVEVSTGRNGKGALIDKFTVLLDRCLAAVDEA